MSSLNFHSSSGDAAVHGSERYHFHWLCNQSFLALLDLGTDSASRPHPIRRAFPANHYTTPLRGREWATRVETAIVAGGFLPSDTLKTGDRRTSISTAVLNTALATGGDQLKLAARLHGQCEIHAFVEGANRAWLAGIIEVGLGRDIFRANAGWEGVIKLLRASSEEPVVTSFSGTDQFPNPYIAIEAGTWSAPAGANEDEDDDAWYELPETEQWRLAMDGLRIQNQARGSMLEMKPDDWEDYRFGDGVTAMDIMDHFAKAGRT